MPPKIDAKELIGKKYGRWTILEEVVKTNPRLRRFLAECECGEKKELHLPVLINGQSRSCGCLKRELIRKRDNYHGLKKTLLYGVWINMKTRCYNKKSEKYHCYGGRGISVCKKWEHDFLAFQKFALENGWDDSLQIDRRNNDKDYSPDNCHFTTRKTNVNNVQILRASNTSGYRGVKRNKYSWVACVKISGHKHLYRAGFQTALHAAIFRDLYIFFNGIQTTLNFNIKMVSS